MTNYKLFLFHIAAILILGWLSGWLIETEHYKSAGLTFAVMLICLMYANYFLWKEKP